MGRLLRLTGMILNINNEILTADFIAENLEIEVYAENLKATN